MIKPMLAYKVDKKPVDWSEKVFMQPKLDGVRCVISKDGAFSRTGKPWLNIDHILSDLKPVFKRYPDLILDGELYNHDLKSDFEKIAEYKDLIESNSELSNLVEDLKTNQNSKRSESYKNISFTDPQLNEAVSRLHIHFFELKINSLISKLEESNDVKLFTEIEDLKKKIENYQNTL